MPLVLSDHTWIPRAHLTLPLASAGLHLAPPGYDKIVPVQAPLQGWLFKSVSPLPETSLSSHLVTFSASRDWLSGHLLEALSGLTRKEVLFCCLHPGYHCQEIALSQACLSQGHRHFFSHSVGGRKSKIAGPCRPGCGDSSLLACLLGPHIACLWGVHVGGERSCPFFEGHHLTGLGLHLVTSFI